MSSEIPLGRKEDQRLEFKGRDALSAPEKIAREVVGMLNAGGGEVWVGLRDEGGRAVAVEAIPTRTEAEREMNRLRDSLLDRIEPAPLGNEFAVRTLEVGAEGFVLQVEVLPQEGRGPYALLSREGRYFGVRVGDRLLPLSLEEIARRFRSAGSDLDVAGGIQKEILEEQTEIQRGAQDLLWIRLKPAHGQELDFSKILQSGLLTDPTQTFSRRTGSTYLEAATLVGPQVGQEVLTIGRKGRLWLRVDRDGGLTFEAPLGVLWEREPDPRGVYPWALMEYPTSVLRLMSQLYRRAEVWEERQAPQVPVVAHLAIFGLGPASLGPGSPQTWMPYLSPNSRKSFEGPDFVLGRPLVLRAEQIRNEPDRCAFRLYKRVYEAFGFDEDAIPPEFDRQTGRLVLPE